MVDLSSSAWILPVATINETLGLCIKQGCLLTVSVGAETNIKNTKSIYPSETGKIFSDIKIKRPDFISKEISKHISFIYKVDGEEDKFVRMIMSPGKREWHLVGIGQLNLYRVHKSLALGYYLECGKPENDPRLLDGLEPASKPVEVIAQRQPIACVNQVDAHRSTFAHSVPQGKQRTPGDVFFANLPASLLPQPVRKIPAPPLASRQGRAAAILAAAIQRRARLASLENL